MGKKLLSFITVGSLAYAYYQKQQVRRLRRCIGEIDTEIDGIECTMKDLAKEIRSNENNSGTE